MKPETRTFATPQDQEYTILLERALRAADAAIAAELARKSDKVFEFDCGFAWVSIPANNGFARWCKAKRAETKRTHFGGPGYPSGWQFWCPGDYLGQSVRVWAAGAMAFAEQLQLAGLSATSSSRLD